MRLSEPDSLDTLSRPPAGMTDTDGPAVGLLAPPSKYPFLEPAQEPDELGRLGRFRILAVLGQGGMGVVFRAEDTHLQRVVALKTMLPEAGRSPRARERFLREAHSIAAVQHEHIVPIHDASEVKDIPYLMMPLLQGQSLDEYLGKPGKQPLPGQGGADGGPAAPLLLSQAEVLRIGQEMAAGLAAAHAAGVVHRDVKPSNVWLEGERRKVRLLDFGLARPECADDLLTQPGAIVGTPAYMAPEQAAGLEVDARSDLFSLGCVLYQLCTGRSAFQRATHLATLDAVRFEETPSPRALNPEVSEALSALVLKLLAKDPKARPASAGEVRDTLARLGQGEQPTITLPGGPEPGKGIRGRRRWDLVAAALASLVGLGLLAVALNALWGEPEDRKQAVSSPERTGKRPPDKKVAEPEPLQVVRIKVKHYYTHIELDGKKRSVVAELGHDSFEPRRDEWVTVKADLTRKAYSFLIAFRPDGTEELCFPEKEDEPPPLTEQPHYPSVNRGNGIQLSEGTGLQVFAVVASSQPLPSWRKWRESWEQRGKMPWKHHKAPAGMVWFDDGVFVEDLTPKGSDRSERGKGKAMPGRTPVVQLTDWLREMPGIEAAGALGFVVLPREKP
jgi:serine/threonine protein kinase